MDQKVKKQFEDAVEAYAKAFCEKHGLQYAGSYWVGDEVGGLLSLEERMIDFSVIRYDMDNDVPALLMILPTKEKRSASLYFKASLHPITEKTAFFSKVYGYLFWIAS